MGRLHEEHPQLKIELVLTNRVQDLLRREADIAVRMTPPRQEALSRGSEGKSLPAYTRDLFSLRTDNDLAQLAMIRCGAGIGMCQVPLARRDAALVRVLPRQISLQLETWITMHEDLRNRPGCRVTFEALVAGLTQHVANGKA